MSKNTLKELLKNMSNGTIALDKLMRVIPESKYDYLITKFIKNCYTEYVNFTIDRNIIMFTPNGLFKNDEELFIILSKSGKKVKEIVLDGVYWNLGDEGEDCFEDDEEDLEDDLEDKDSTLADSLQDLFSCEADEDNEVSDEEPAIEEDKEVTSKFSSYEELEKPFEELEKPFEELEKSFEEFETEVKKARRGRPKKK